MKEQQTFRVVYDTTGVLVYLRGIGNYQLQEHVLAKLGSISGVRNVRVIPNTDDRYDANSHVTVLVVPHLAGETVRVPTQKELASDIEHSLTQE